MKDKMDKTVVIEIVRSHMEPKYHKYVRTKKHYKAHDEENRCKVGDMVLIREARPISKEKRWLVEEIVKQEPILVQEEVGENDTGENQLDEWRITRAPKNSVYKDTWRIEKTLRHCWGYYRRVGKRSYPRIRK